MTHHHHARLGRNSLMNLVGYSVPAGIGLVAVPVLVDALGADLFGVLSLVWVSLTYLTLLDFGVGRALTHALADCLMTGRSRDMVAHSAGAIAFLLAAGIAGGTLVYGLAPFFVRNVLGLPEGVIDDSVNAFRIVACGLPVIISMQGLQAVLASHGRFDVINALRIPGMSLVFGLPAVAVAVRPTLAAVTLALVIAHGMTWVAYAVACTRIMPELLRPLSPQRAHIGHLLRFGGWLTVSNVIGPILLYVDRFLIARFLSAAAVAYYTVPFSVVTQLWLVPRAVIEALFPALVTEYASGQRPRQLYHRGLAYTLVVLVPVTVLLVLVARPALSLWLGPEFASESSHVAQILAVAVLINAIGLVATAAIQAAGRPDLTAKLHMVETPLYLTYLAVLLMTYGIIGAAVAWLLRVTASALVLTVIAQRLVRGPADVRTLTASFKSAEAVSGT